MLCCSWWVKQTVSPLTIGLQCSWKQNLTSIWQRPNARRGYVWSQLLGRLIIHHIQVTYSCMRSMVEHDTIYAARYTKARRKYTNFPDQLRHNHYDLVMTG
jgi:hypothetical protein